MVEAGLVHARALPSRDLSRQGKVEEIAGLVKSLDAGVVVMDCALSPVQQRNLEKAWNAKVLDRTGLILEISAGARARAKAAAGRARASDLSEGPAGADLDPSGAPARRLRLPGRTGRDADRGRPPHDRRAPRQDRRRTRKVKRTRALHRESRSRVPYPIVALVGYTNAGKSTLFNRLTRRERAVGRHAVRDARSDAARRRPAARHAHDPFRYGRLHLRPADHAGRGVPRHAGGGDRGRHHRARARHVARRPRGAIERRRNVLRELGIDRERDPRADRGLEQDRPARCRQSGRGWQIWPNAGRRSERPVLVSA